MITNATCYKSVTKPNGTDLILTDKKISFQSSKTIDTGLSDLHKMTITLLKAYFQKLPPTKITYPNYKKLDNMYSIYEYKGHVFKNKIHR